MSGLYRCIGWACVVLAHAIMLAPRMIEMPEDFDAIQHSRDMWLLALLGLAWLVLAELAEIRRSVKR
jgi:hypothetical protein